MSPTNCSPDLPTRPGFALVDFDCDHMVAQARPVETAAVIRKALG